MRSIAKDPRKIASEYRSLSEIMAKIGDLRGGSVELVDGDKGLVKIERELPCELVYSSDGCQLGHNTVS